MHGASSNSQVSSRRSLETELELAVRSGELNLQSKQFTEFPSLLLKRYVLADTRDVNLSKNKLQEIPVECSQFPNLEKLIMYNNIIRYVILISYSLLSHVVIFCFLSLHTGSISDTLMYKCAPGFRSKVCSNCGSGSESRIQALYLR